ncbi:hypothetical protein KC573_04020 [candidate division WWE3 bacterium]|uniref:Uncharacterized protein n=1 Tax=candidate division WWE3 bacterium TaxID=2053526 RepID=A0A955LWF8_UNCKA|nr:hypothetical protein [candidate division WWE3 bacterium]
MTQNFHVAKNQTNKEGQYVPRDKAVEDIQRILNGQYDDVPDSKFMFIGSSVDLNL